LGEDHLKISNRIRGCLKKIMTGQRGGMPCERKHTVYTAANLNCFRTYCAVSRIRNSCELQEKSRISESFRMLQTSIKMYRCLFLLNRVLCLFPFYPPAFQCINAGIAHLYKFKRHTGTCCFVMSSAVQNYRFLLSVFPGP
jgi:hypothetical protein